MGTFIEHDADLPLMQLCRQVPLARSSDPVTSHEAARRAPVAAHRVRVLEALRSGPAGQTEIARRCGLLPHEVNKRLADLEKLGQAEPTGRKVAGGREREWRVK